MLEQVLSVDTIVGHIGVEQWLDGGISKVNLKPTNYCTAMWNGRRCTGEHELSRGYHVWTYCEDDRDLTGDTFRGGAMWSDRGARFDYFLDTGRHINGIATAPEGLQSAGQTAEIQFAGQLAAIGTWSLLETLSRVSSDWAVWAGKIAAGLVSGSAVDPQWEMSTESFTPVEAIFPHSLYPVVNCQCPHCLPGRDEYFAEMGTGSFTNA